MTHSATVSKQSKENQEKAVIPDTAEIIITKAQLRILIEGLSIWNCPALDALAKFTDKGQSKLFAAQDLCERLWKEK